jgi:hypothetical protein
LLDAFYFVKINKIGDIMRKSKKAEQLAYHDAWLRRMGVHPQQLAKKTKARPSIPDYSTKQTHPTSDRVGNGFVRGSKKYAGTGVTIGQAYNKGNLVVLSKSEANDDQTGKRR